MGLRLEIYLQLIPMVDAFTCKLKGFNHLANIDNCASDICATYYTRATTCEDTPSNMGYDALRVSRPKL